MNEKIIIGNWKNYLNKESSINLANNLADFSYPDEIKLMVSPNNLFLDEVNDILSTSPIEVIAQNVTSYDSSADTGGITSINLENLGVNRTIFAHSEVRMRSKFPPEEILPKIIDQKFQFVYCFEEINQIPFSILKNDFEIILAYEPVWAIGTGETASLDHIEEVHGNVKNKLSESKLNIPILYGGSVNPSNSKEILSSNLIDGVLVGGASTKFDQFVGIINSI